MTTSPQHSFIVRRDTGREMINNWHYHPEIEILLIHRSAGTMLVGDFIGPFHSGDVLVFGADLPHCLRHEDAFLKQKKQGAGETICIKFHPRLTGQAFLDLPEARPVNTFIQSCANGWRLHGALAERIGQQIIAAASATPGRQLIQLLSMMEEMVSAGTYEELSSTGFMQQASFEKDDRLKQVFDYTFANFTEKISIAEVAGMLHMTRQSFCRYFKGKTQKTYIHFVMEVRIGHACRLLAEDSGNVAEVSYACGYSSISHFISQFKEITGRTPLEYKRDYARQ